MYVIYYKVIVSCVLVNPVVAGSEWKGYQLYNRCKSRSFSPPYSEDNQNRQTSLVQRIRTGAECITITSI